MAGRGGGGGGVGSARSGTGPSPEDGGSGGGGGGGDGGATDDDDDESRAAAAAAARAEAEASAAWERQPLRAVDLDNLTAAATRQMDGAADDVALPPGSVHTPGREYDTWSVPHGGAAAPTGVGAVSDDDPVPLVPVADLPAWAVPAFGDTRSLNRMQSRVFPAVFEGEDNVLVSAPTGAGKTTVALLAILREAGRFLGTGAGGGVSDGEGDAAGVRGSAPPPPLVSSAGVAAFKAVYIAPMKALVAEVVANLSAKLEPLGLTVAELTGDATLSRSAAAATHVLVATPEKWDVITRKAAGRGAVAPTPRLLILDEVHLLADGRGAVLEVLVARALATARIVGLSATLPNAADVAAFLRVPPSRGLFVFGPAYRPVALATTYVGITAGKPLRRHALLNELAWEHVRGYVIPDGHQVLVFVHSRKDTAATARYLREAAAAAGRLDAFIDATASEVVEAEVEGVTTEALAELLPSGIGIHHAGLPRGDRALVEALFADGHLRVLVCTATLAWGVNLPARAVVIKGTDVYSADAGGWVPLSPLDVTQMMGRAGRPQYDTRGEGVIITSRAHVRRYLALLTDQLPVESRLLAALPDALSAEVCLGGVATIDDGAAWLARTFLYVRMLRCPDPYGVPPGDLVRDPTLRRRRRELVAAAATVLAATGLLRFDRAARTLRGTALGRIAAGHYVTWRTAAAYAAGAAATTGDADLLRLVAGSVEFSSMRVRGEEALELTRLAERVPLPVRGELTTPAAKVAVLLQAYVSRLPLAGLALGADMVYVSQSAARLVRAIFHVARSRRWAALAARAHSLALSLSQRQWASQSALRQFGSALSADTLRRVERKDVPLERYYDLSAAEVGELLRDPAAGRRVHKLVHALPHVEVDAKVAPLTRGRLQVELTLTPDWAYDPAVHGAGEAFWVWVTDGDGEVLLHSELVYIRGSLASEAHILTLELPLAEAPPPAVYFVRVVADGWIAPAVTLPVSFRRLVLPDRFRPYTSVADRLPLSVVEAFTPLGDDEGGDEDGAAKRSRLANGGPATGGGGGRDPRLAGVVDHFHDSFTVFKPLQSQAFDALFHSPENALVMAPGGAGRNALVDVALAALFLARPTAVAVIVECAGAPAVARRAAALAASRLAATFALSVITLTGDAAADARALAPPPGAKTHPSGVVAFAAPATWDALSRRWKQRRAVRTVGLLLLRDVHFVGATGPSPAGAAPIGPVIEALASRARYMAAEAAAKGRPPTRLVALGEASANAHDVGDWLGVPPGGVFSFAPGARTPGVAVDVVAVPALAEGLAADALAPPTLRAIRSYRADAVAARGSGGPLGAPPPHDKVLVLVPTRPLARALAAELAAAPSIAADDGGGVDADVDGGGRVAAAAREAADRAAVAGLAPAAAAAATAAAGRALVGSAAAAVGLAAVARTLRSRPAAAAVSGGVLVTPPPGDADAAAVAAAWADPASPARLLIATPDDAWADASLRAPLVIVAGTDGAPDDARRAEAAPGWALAHALGRASAAAVLLTDEARREAVAAAASRGLVLESGLDAVLVEQLNAEVAARVVESKQDALDYLTWTFFYRRLPRNATYYALAGAGHAAISEHLSVAVEGALAELEAARCVAVEGDDDAALGPLNLGMVAAFYYVSPATVELFAASVGPRTRVRGLLEIVAAAAEFADLPIRQTDASVLRRLAAHAVVPLAAVTADGADADARLADPHVKAQLLWQSHLARLPAGRLGPALAAERAGVVARAERLLGAAVDVVASAGTLLPALAAMELVQLTVQALWLRSSPLLQLPGMDAATAGVLADRYGVSDVFDLIDMDDADRSAALGGLGDGDLRSLAAACNAFPNVELSLEAAEGEGAPGEAVTINVRLVRDADGDDGDDDGEDGDGGGGDGGDGGRRPRSGAPAVVPTAVAPHFPGSRLEGWWLVVGEEATNALLAVKRVWLKAEATQALVFPAPVSPGVHLLDVSLMSDSYVQCDQVERYTLTVGGA